MGPANTCTVTVSASSRCSSAARSPASTSNCSATGSQLRDCLHVDDVVDAMLLAAVQPASVGEVFNLGHPEALSLAEIARLTVESAGTGAEIKCAPWPDGLERIDIGSFQGDFTKATTVLGWSPRISFADGIASTIGWYQARA